MKLDVYVPGKKKHDGETASSAGKFILLAVMLVTFAVLKIIFSVQFAKDSSMEPAYKKGTILLINKFSGISKNDPVLVKLKDRENQAVVSRIIAVAGDNVEIRGKKIFVNGAEKQIVIRDERIFSAEFTERDNMAKITVPDDSFFLLGDNFDRAYDSRFFGVVKSENLVGKIIFNIL
ncbi:MAG TPA: signal peptidase I [Spirochaetota bacterium]|nr:signal peptidase I [Spirochaetota bacterium]